NEIINDDNDVKKIRDNNKYQLSWIPYKNLISIEAKIYKAEFEPKIKNGSTFGFTVALKEFIF
ncbi:27962_t:CDS:1, partial [Gigaspora margarita]